MAETELLIIGSAYTEEERARLEAFCAAEFLPSSDDIAALAPDVRAGVRTIAYKSQRPLGAAQMDLLPALGLVANYGVGFDAIDIAAADARGIRVTNTPDVLSDDVADLAVAMLLAQFRTLRQGEDWVRKGTWAERGELPLNRQVSGASVGIVGLGRIGREIADRLAAFKMQVHYTSRSEKQTPGWTYHPDAVALARAVDVLVVALVGGPQTRNAISSEVIEALGPRGVLINISRGSTVDEAALLDALEQGRLAGAGLDVFWNEPNIDPRFLALDSVVLQPHQGSNSVETRRAMAQLQQDNIAAFHAGAPLLTPVN